MLRTKHFFPFVRMIKALDIKNDLKDIYQKVQGKSEKELEKLDSMESFDVLYIFFEKIPNAEKEIIKFLSIYLEKPIEEIEEMPLDEMIKTITGLFSDPNFKAFFQQAVK